jgi:hypothetical protein
MEFEMNKIRLAIFLLGFTILLSGKPAFGQRAKSTASVHKVYVGSFGAEVGAEYLQKRLSLRLGRTHNIVVVDDPSAADFVLNGSAASWFRGYYCSNLRPSYLNHNCSKSYGAKMEMVLEDSSGRILWSGTLSPRFWGSDNPFENVVKQAAMRVYDSLHQ